MFHRTLSSAYSTFLSAIICLFAVPHFTAAQIGGNDRDFAFGMLDMTKDAIKKTITIRLFTEWISILYSSRPASV